MSSAIKWVVSCVAIAALFSITGSRDARADDEPPPVRRQSSTSGGGGSVRWGTAHASGSNGIRPFLGVEGHLDVDRPSAVGGNKFVFGADFMFGPPTGLGFLAGMHLGAGRGAFELHPLVEVQYRFRLGIPLVPWIAGGGGARIAFARGNSTALAITFRFVAGVEYYVTDSIGIGMQLAIPDLGPLLAPSVAVVGTIEWTIGPHFRF